MDSEQENEDISAEKMGSQKQTSGSKSPSLSGNAVPRKRLSKDERIRAAEENKLRKEVSVSYFTCRFYFCVFF